MKSISILLALSLGAQVKVELGQPRLVTAGPKEEHRWGRWQFPTLEQAPGGRMLLMVHVEQDSAASYGKPRKIFVSADQGKSWNESADAATGPYGLHLKNGDWLRTDTLPATPAASIRLPAQRAERISYKTPYQLYSLMELPESLRNIFFQRYSKDSWHAEKHPIDDPHAFRYATGGLIPQIWWGDIKTLKNNTLVALTYPYYHDSQPTPYTASASYESRDQGRSWTKLGHILYEEEDKRRDGFTEPALELLKDGSLFAVLRTTDGNGVGPMFRTRSKDGARTWSRPKPFTETGVLPRLLQLKNGVLVLSSGRPGVDLRFSIDNGETWSKPSTLVPVPDPSRPQADSCGYTSLLPIARDRFVIAYSWFTPPSGQKSIFVREVRVSKSN